MELYFCSTTNQFLTRLSTLLLQLHFKKTTQLTHFFLPLSPDIPSLAVLSFGGLENLSIDMVKGSSVCQPTSPNNFKLCGWFIFLRSSQINQNRN